MRSDSTPPRSASCVPADLDRLSRIASVLDEIAPGYRVTLDGNENYVGVGVVELWDRMASTAALRQLCRRVALVEQPIARQATATEPVDGLARRTAVIIDESDDSLDAFPRARELGYTGTSSKTCKGLYKSVLNAARCDRWNRDEATAGRAHRYRISGEDLTIQAGVALQQDLALVALLGLDHVERNGHDYADGMAGVPVDEQRAFLAAHPDLYEDRHGAVRLRIVGGAIAFGSLGGPGFARGADPDWSSMTPMPIPSAG